ncbi:1-(5-phosphoribosyl)-5-[(5-phosphoribosylamino)methylideneamino] imidazole-4-carboxamide isomerase [Legionella spiritensis]|uniref:1-(5-phosphoribosyl)-5-[(5- phosphoribosylamino)methylideneamino] imidazole-4-carboxamide isomerase n=1 Tax=Legionella spiritensis TaxID=452 RepID=UPI000F6F5653|nr:1-(5-phosphoribosyl)-5-[(5-phosphoribosylamino)methylideneamino] imidazole-4-carboxamide isomerase [Legionella spiritensis]VEG90463.1 phosphoribosylformimino-5-aminoimidazole carboxamide ribotide isomerase [Legionella spiritensis]
MILIPAIDIQQGQCVRLRQGDFNQATVYKTSPMELAQSYYDQGVRRIHLVDMDGAKSGEIKQLPLLKDIQSLGLTVQAGGGIRNLSCAQSCLNAGINQLVLGSIAISDPEHTLEIMAYCGINRVILALDVRLEQGIPKPVIHGWQTKTDCSLWDIVAYYQNVGVKTILCTNVACDGMMKGPDFSLYEEAIRRFPDLCWQASGGIRDQEDISRLQDTGLSAAILGRLLYETDFSLITALQGDTVC